MKFAAGCGLIAWLCWAGICCISPEGLTVWNSAPDTIIPANLPFVSKTGEPLAPWVTLML